MSGLDFKNHTLENARDLGGIPVAGGRKVKFGKLIRSNAIADASASDIEKLGENYDMNMIIDLRCDGEIKKKEDPMYLLPGVLYVNIPLANGDVPGIVHTGSIKELIGLEKVIKDDPEGMMEKMYSDLVSDKYSQKALAHIFRLLLSNSEGCHLWHCTAGKDRAGIVSAVVLLALGASRETVINDYTKTNECMGHYLKHLKKELILMSKTAKANMPIVNDANPEYLHAALDAIDRDFGGIEAYLNNQLGVTKKDRKALRDLYTE